MNLRVAFQNLRNRSSRILRVWAELSQMESLLNKLDRTEAALTSITEETRRLRSELYQRETRGAHPVTVTLLGQCAMPGDPLSYMDPSPLLAPADPDHRPAVIGDEVCEASREASSHELTIMSRGKSSPMVGAKTIMLAPGEHQFVEFQPQRFIAKSALVWVNGPGLLEDVYVGIHTCSVVSMGMGVMFVLPWPVEIGQVVKCLVVGSPRTVVGKPFSQGDHHGAAD